MRVLTKKQAQTIAYLWHGGQSDPLYAFASSGHIGPDLYWNVRTELRYQRDLYMRLDPQAMSEAVYRSNMDDLLALLRYVRHQGAPVR